MISKSLFFVFGAMGGTVPLFYISKNGLKFNSEKVSNQMVWECQIKNFETLDLNYVTLKSSSFQLIHCHKEKQYDWQIALPKFILDLNTLDRSKNFELISEEREDNVNAIKVVQGTTSAFKDWLLIRKINSHNIFESIGTKIGYSNLFEFEIISSSKVVGKSWVIL